MPDEGLYVPPMGGIRVSGKPLEEGMREKFTEFIDILTKRIGELESAPDHSIIFAFNVGKGFVVTPRFKKHDELDPFTAIEVIDYDPSTRRTLSIGKRETPRETPLIWWGFRLFNKTNFGLLLLSENKEEREIERREVGSKQKLPRGVWHETADGRRVPGIGELVNLKFPPETVMNIIASCSDDMAKRTRLCEEDFREVEFADGKLILSKEISGFFE